MAKDSDKKPEVASMFSDYNRAKAEGLWKKAGRSFKKIPNQIAQRKTEKKVREKTDTLRKMEIGKLMDRINKEESL